MSDPDSGDLLLAAAGDGVAFQRLLERWRQPIFTFFHRAKETSAATEAAVETFVRLYQTAGQYAPATPFPVWLYGIASRVLQSEAPAPVPHIPPQRPQESPAARAALARAALAALPGGERAAFLLTRAAQLSVPMTARVLGIPEAEVPRRLVRAMESLRRTLEPLLEAGPLRPGTTSEQTVVLDRDEEPR